MHIWLGRHYLEDCSLDNYLGLWGVEGPDVWFIS